MLDFDAKGPKSKDFPVESQIPPLLGLHLRLEIGTSARPNRRNFARGIRFRGLKLPKRRGNALFFNFSACGGLYSYPPFFSFIPSSRKWVQSASLLDPLELQATGTPFREKNVTSLGKKILFLQVPLIFHVYVFQSALYRRVTIWIR